MRVRVLGARGRFAPAALASSGYMKMGLHWMLKSMKSAIGLYGRSLPRSEEHTSELQSLMRSSYAVFCLRKKKLPSQIYVRSRDLHANVNNISTVTYRLQPTVHD